MSKLKKLNRLNKSKTLNVALALGLVASNLVAVAPAAYAANPATAHIMSTANKVVATTSTVVNKLDPQDVKATITTTSELKTIKYGKDEILFTLEGDEVTISGAVLSELSNGSKSLKFDFASGSDKTLRVTITDKEPKISSKSVSFSNRNNKGKDIKVSVYGYGLTLNQITNDGDALSPEAYEVGEPSSSGMIKVTILKDYLSTLENGSYPLEFEFNGTDVTPGITLKVSNNVVTAAKVESVSAESDSGKDTITANFDKAITESDLGKLVLKQKVDANTPKTIAADFTLADDGLSATAKVDSVVATAAEQTVIYSVSYNSATAVEANAITVAPVVVDAEKPVITLIGDATMNLRVGDTFTDPGVTITDNIDADLVPVITGEVDTTKAGTYTLQYNVSDTAGNAADEVIRTVVVAEALPMVSSVSALNATDIQVILPASSTLAEAGLVGKTITVKDATSELVATYKADSLSDKKATFVLGGTDKLKDATTYTVSADWATFESDSFLAKVAAAYVADFQFTTTGFMPGKDSKVYFTAKNQYGEELKIDATNTLYVAAVATKGAFPLKTTYTVGNDYITIADQLVEGDKIIVTLTNKDAEGKQIANTTSGELTVVKGEASVPTAISNVTTAQDLTDLKAGDKVTLEATVLDQFNNPMATLPTGTMLRWVTSDKSIVGFGGDVIFKDGGSETDLKMEVTMNKEGSATITAFTPDGKASKSFTFAVGQGKIASIDTSSVGTLLVTNKATLDKANVGVNAAEGSTLVFKNANGTNIPAKADDVSFVVTPATDFNASDVAVEKVVDASGYLTGIKVTSNRAVQSTEEKVGDYTKGVDYTVTVKSTNVGIADKTFKVTSIIDKKVSVIETPTTAGFRADNSATLDLVFKNAKGEVLNVSGVTFTADAGLTYISQKTVDGKYVDAVVGDIVTGVKMSSTAKGNYSLLINVGAVSKTVSVTVGDPSLLQSINAGSKVTGVVAGDSDVKAKYNKVAFIDQDGKEMSAQIAAVSVKDSAGTAVDASKLAKLAKTYTVAENGDVAFVEATSVDPVVAVKILADSSLAKGTYTVTITSGEKSASFNVEVGEARVLKSITATPKIATVGLGSTSTINVKSVDQYGDFFTVDTPMIKGDAYVSQVADSWKALDKDGKVTGDNDKTVGYQLQIKGNNNGVGTLSITKGDVTETVSVTVAPTSEIVKSLVLAGDDVNSDGTAKYALRSGTETDLDAKGQDSNGNVVSINQSDVVWSSSDTSYATVDGAGLIKAVSNIEKGKGKEVTITADVLGVKQTFKVTVSNDDSTLLLGTLAVSDAEKLDSDTATAGIQIALDDDSKDGEANGTILIAFTGKNQYGESFADVPVTPTSFNAGIAKVGKAAPNEVTITAVAAAETKVRVVSGSDEIFFNVKVSDKAAFAANVAPTLSNAKVGDVDAVLSNEGKTLTFNVDPATVYSTGSVTLSEYVTAKINIAGKDVTFGVNPADNLMQMALDLLKTLGGTPDNGVTGQTLIENSGVKITLTDIGNKSTEYTVVFNKK